jgi:hypothetical protein
MALACAYVDPSTYSSQSHSLAIISVLKLWLEADFLHKVKFWYVLLNKRWDLYGKVHMYVKDSCRRTTVALFTYTTLNYCREQFTAKNLDYWDNLFNDLKYYGLNFYIMFTKSGKWARLTYLKGRK